MNDTIVTNIGLDAEGKNIELDIVRAPHVLVAGMTGSGKSMLVNSILTDLIGIYPPTELGLVLIDPKRVEYSQFAKAPQLLWPPIYSVDYAKEVVEQLANVEMNVRFGHFEKNGARNIEEMNAMYAPGDRIFTRILIFVDELANLILADRTFEKSLVKIASMGRAAGMHMVLATQRPSADVLTGLLRANIPTRISLSVVTKMDSRIILDEPGAERLTRPGDMLARLPGSRELRRARCNPATDDDIREVVWAAANPEFSCFLSTGAPA